MSNAQRSCQHTEFSRNANDTMSVSDVAAIDLDIFNLAQWLKVIVSVNYNVFYRIIVRSTDKM